MSTTLEEIRCGACARKLGMGSYSHLQIKCPRCGTLNTLRATPADPGEQRSPSERPERHLKLEVKMTTDREQSPPFSHPPAQPLVPWVGGKRRLAPLILPLFPEQSCYVEPFCGAAALFFLKAPARVEVLNDSNGDLARLYRVVTHHLDEFVRQFRWALNSREMFKWLQDTPPDTLTDIQRAARFYYLQKCSFGGKVHSQTFGTATTAKASINLLRMEEDLSAVHLRLHQVFIENLDWAKCVAKYDRPHSLFYLDPPYWGTEGYGVGFGLEQYDRMAELLATMKGQAIVSVNDIPEMRQAFKAHDIKRVSISYTVGASGKGREPKGELIISNFRPAG